MTQVLEQAQALSDHPVEQLLQQEFRFVTQRELLQAHLRA